jgi:hypothetical protein
MAIDSIRPSSFAATQNIRKVSAEQKPSPPPTQVAPEVNKPQPQEPAEINFRKVYNRVLNSELDRSDKTKFIDRIKNAVANKNQSTVPDATDAEKTTSAEVSRKRYLAEA